MNIYLKMNILYYYLNSISYYLIYIYRKLYPKNNHEKKYSLLNLAKTISENSPDPNTKVGCIIETPGGQLIEGYNDVPNGILITDKRITRPEKYNWIEHAERNAIYKAVRKGIKLENSKIYLNWYPCIDCARGIIQSGIKELVIEKEPDLNDKRWGDQFKVVSIMLNEANIIVNVIGKYSYK